MIIWNNIAVSTSRVERLGLYIGIYGDIYMCIPINRLAAVETDIDLASCLMCESHAMQRGHGGRAAGLAGGSGDWLVARQLGLAGGSGPCRTGNPLEPPHSNPCRAGSALEAPHSAPVQREAP